MDTNRDSRTALVIMFYLSIFLSSCLPVCLSNCVSVCVCFFICYSLCVSVSDFFSCHFLCQYLCVYLPLSLPVYNPLSFLMEGHCLFGLLLYRFTSFTFFFLVLCKDVNIEILESTPACPLGRLCDPASCRPSSRSGNPLFERSSLVLRSKVYIVV